MLLSNITKNVQNNAHLVAEATERQHELYTKIIDILNRNKNLIFSIEWEQESMVDMKRFLRKTYSYSKGRAQVIFDHDPSIRRQNAGAFTYEIKMCYLDYVSFPKLHPFLKQAFDEGKCKKNLTCGYHIHIDSALLPMVKRLGYAMYFGKRLVELTRDITAMRTEIQERTTGRGSTMSCWCSPSYKLHRNALVKFRNGEDGGRYKLVNFDAMYKHGTIENRLFYSPYKYDDFLYKTWLILSITDEYAQKFQEERRVFELDGDMKVSVAKVFNHPDLGEIKTGGGVANSKEEIVGEKTMLDFMKPREFGTFDIRTKPYIEEIAGGVTIEGDVRTTPAEDTVQSSILYNYDYGEMRDWWDDLNESYIRTILNSLYGSDQHEGSHGEPLFELCWNELTDREHTEITDWRTDSQEER